MTETKELNSFTELLREENIDSWRAATTHRFVRELANDTISDDVFRRYLVQDFSFVETLVDLAAYAVAKATTMAAKRKLSTFLRTITNDETNYFQRALNAVGAPGAFHTPPPLNDVTDAFRTMMLDTASNGSYAEILSILVPAEWIYLTWATAARDAGKRPGRFYLDEWIELHSRPDFADFVAWLREELDRELAAGPATRSRATALFAETVDLEVKFFDAIYEMPSDS